MNRIRMMEVDDKQAFIDACTLAAPLRLCLQGPPGARASQRRGP